MKIGKVDITKLTAEQVLLNRIADLQVQMNDAMTKLDGLLRQRPEEFTVNVIYNNVPLEGKLGHSVRYDNKGIFTELLSAKLTPEVVETFRKIDYTGVVGYALKNKVISETDKAPFGKEGDLKLTIEGLSKL